MPTIMKAQPLVLVFFILIAFSVNELACLMTTCIIPDITVLASRSSAIDYAGGEQKSDH